MVATQLQTDFSVTQTAQKSGTYLNIEPATFRAHFHHQPFTIRHNLAGHELFTLPRLIELAQRLPGDRVEYNAGNIPVSQDPATTPRNGLSIEETMRRIEECRSWLVLKNVEQDPAYAALLNGCLNEIKTFSEPIVPGMCRREGYVFITSPDSVTPYHMDNEYNFLLQIRGQKQISLFDRADRSILSELELETFYTGGHRNLTFKDEYQAKAQVFQLTPGDGLHFPITAPHWVKNGPAVSISFSITFRTPASEKRELVFRVNAGLRKLGLTPTTAGVAPGRDALKATAYRAWRRAQTLAGRAA